ncbi:hypothetical protein QFC19_006286 [Naganishia cerealis]|uniref:Uncharacterized protein n=1 Tax=Naganishia cerealis TaxID=610337 RepID=A0ACC2VI15_9TREE|nr:hypothetical protein QFC19_006286 [Naganishia cerealis]
MRQFRQEDAHEFFRYGIDLLHNEALKVAKATKESHAVKETSWIHKVWGGRLRSRITCHECGNNSDTFDAFLDLSLDLDRNTESVKDALARFVQKDSLSGKNKYKCEKCKKLVNATKQMQIVKAPEVLSLHLKRFTPTGRKITSTIRYTANLSLDPYMDKESKSPFYELYAVTVHQGSGPHLGHYYSFVKNKNGKWFEANDESVNASQAKIYASAYILHYIRKPGSALDAIKAGKQTGLNTPRKSTSDDVRQERSDLPVSTPVGGSSSPSKRGEKRKQRNEDPTTEDEQPVQRRERQQDSATPRADASVTADDDSSRDGEQHIRKKNRAQGKPFAPVSPQQFGFGTSSVSQALKSTQGSDRMFEARPPVHGHKKGGKNRAGKVNSSPYATGGMDGKHKKTRMMGRNFKR